MAKSGSKNGSNDNMVICSSGTWVKIKPISVKLLELFDLNHQTPEPPMTEAQAAGGVIELVPNPDDVAYKEALKAFNAQATNDFLALVLDLGIDVDIPTDTGWVKTLKRIGITVPEDADDKRMMYIQTILMPDFMSDLRNITAAVLKRSGVSEEAVASWVALF